MKRLLTIGAVRLGRSVDFVRRLDDEGVLKSEPHRQGEHRRYREEAVAAYRAKQERQRRRTPARAPSKSAHRPPAPRRRIPIEPEPDPFLEEDEPPDAWIEPCASEAPTPRALSLNETLYLETLRTVGMLGAPPGLPAGWRAKLEAELEQYVTLERFPMNGDPFARSFQVSKHIRELLEPYRQEQAAEADRQRKQQQAAQAAMRRRQALIDYGRQLADQETASWAPDDPIAEARRDVELVLEAEVKADWEESDVRKLVEERLERYEEDDEEESGE